MGEPQLQSIRGHSPAIAGIPLRIVGRLMGIYEIYLIYGIFPGLAADTLSTSISFGSDHDRAQTPKKRRKQGIPANLLFADIH